MTHFSKRGFCDSSRQGDFLGVQASDLPVQGVRPLQFGLRGVVGEGKVAPSQREGGSWNAQQFFFWRHKNEG